MISNTKEILKSNILFVALTLRDVRFYIQVAKEVSRRFPEVEVTILSVFQPGNDLIRESGIPFLDFYQYLDKVPDSIELEKVWTQFDIDDPNSLLLHEKVTFGIQDDDSLRERLGKYLVAAGKILNDWSRQKPKSKSIVFQELGGFFVNLAVFLSSKKYQIEHYFFEPAFFKGRLCAVKNTATSLLLENPEGQRIIPEATLYLRQLRNERTVVVPQKDQHHFMDMGIKKVFNLSNAEKICSKISNKYIHRYRFEFDHTVNHVRRTLRMFINRKMRDSLYLQKDHLPEKYVYFPLHVELDCSLTIRSPKYFDQIGLLGEIMKMLPPGTHLIAKEHPASIGGFDQKRLRKLIEDFPGFHLMHPSINSYDLLEKALAVVTINSKVGAEALVFQKPVLVLGDAFYSKWKVATYCEDLESLAQKLGSMEKVISPTDSKLETCFSQAWDHSFEGELYVEDEENIKRFVSGISPAFY